MATRRKRRGGPTVVELKPEQIEGMITVQLLIANGQLYVGAQFGGACGDDPKAQTEHERQATRVLLHIRAMVEALATDLGLTLFPNEGEPTHGTLTGIEPTPSAGGGTVGRA